MDDARKNQKKPPKVNRVSLRYFSESKTNNDGPRAVRTSVCQGLVATASGQESDESQPAREWVSWRVGVFIR